MVLELLSQSLSFGGHCICDVAQINFGSQIPLSYSEWVETG